MDLARLHVVTKAGLESLCALDSTLLHEITKRYLFYVVMINSLTSASITVVSSRVSQTNPYPSESSFLEHLNRL